MPVQWVDSDFCFLSWDTERSELRLFCEREVTEGQIQLNKKELSPRYNHLTLDSAAQGSREFHMTKHTQTGVGSLLLGEVTWGPAIYKHLLGACETELLRSCPKNDDSQEPAFLTSFLTLMQVAPTIAIQGFLFGV